MKDVQAFIAHFQISSAPGTASVKTGHIFQVSLKDGAFISGRYDLLKGQAAVVSEYLHTTPA